MKNIILLFTIVIFISSCSKFKFAVVNAPSLSFKGEIKQDIAYGELDAQRLDIYLPESASPNHPVVVFFHGGRWTFGNKQQYTFVGMTLAELGYIAVLPNTRLYPNVKFPTFVEDTAQAVAWVHNNIEQYGGNGDLFVSGHSSGAHMGALVIANDTYLQPYGLAPDIVNAFAGISGPYDFEPKTEDLRDMFGPPSQFPHMVITGFIDGDEPPMLLVYTEDDETVGVQNIQRLEAAILKANGMVETKIYQHGDHAAPVAAFSWVNPSDLSVPQDIDRFFKAHATK